MFKNIEGLIFDWAGTTVDYGCFAPVNVFVSIFSEKGINITLEEARYPMGMLKKDHIKAILEMDRIQALWQEKFNRPSSVKDIDDLYSDFEPRLMAILDQFSRPIDHVTRVTETLRSKGLKIGSTTGYTDKMIEIVARNAHDAGYSPDTIVTPDSTGLVGRPMPYMIFENMRRLSLSAPWKVVKVGDTLSDIKEGINAGTWSVGILIGSSQIGMSEEGFNKLNETDQQKALVKARKSFEQAGAHFVINTMEDLEPLLMKVDELIEGGERP